MGQAGRRHDQEAILRTSTLLALAATALVALAGCGSSSKTTSSSAESAGGYGVGTAGKSSTTTTPASTTASGGTSASGGVVIVTKHSKDGTILAAGPKKATVYLFEADNGSTSACTGACAGVWPPVTSSSGASALGGAQASQLGTITRSDGTKQVTYNGHPLYFYAKDQDAEDAYGQGIKSFGSDWYVLKPTGEKVDES
jgi:predicted lipoprotein with Yx(FWY)xxD motif